jgi:Arc/MetJ-type ribon-helix-helix transcriptional regulator
MMKRVTVTLPERMTSALDREARRRHTSVSEVVRLALKKHLHLLDPEDGPRRLPFDGIIAPDGKLHDDSERFDEILSAEWEDWIAQGSGLAGDR